MIYRLVDFTATIVATHPPAPTTGRTTVLQSGCGGGKDDGRGALSKRITLCGPTKTNSATDPRSDHLPLPPSRPLDRTAVNRLAFPALSLARYLHNSHGNRFSFPILRPIESNEREDRFDERESEMNETLRDGKKEGERDARRWLVVFRRRVGRRGKGKKGRDADAGAGGKDNTVTDREKEARKIAETRGRRRRRRRTGEEREREGETCG